MTITLEDLLKKLTPEALREVEELVEKKVSEIENDTYIIEASCASDFFEIFDDEGNYTSGIAVMLGDGLTLSDDSKYKILNVLKEEAGAGKVIGYFEDGDSIEDDISLAESRLAKGGIAQRYEIKDGKLVPTNIHSIIAKSKTTENDALESADIVPLSRKELPVKTVSASIDPATGETVYTDIFNISGDYKPNLPESSSSSDTIEKTEGTAFGALGITMHPGEYLKEMYMVDGETAFSIGKKTGLCVFEVNDVLSQRFSITPEIAKKLSKLGRSAESWLALQRDYDLQKEKDKNA